MKQILKYTILCLFLYFTPTFAFSFCNEQIHAITEDLNWNLDENGVLTVTGKGEMNFNVIPWLKKKNYIREVKIGEGITTIQDDAFNNCFNIEKINLPNSLKEVGVSSFACGSHKIKEIIIPDSVEIIKMGAFSSLYQLENLKIGSSVCTIEAKAFYGCCHKLKHIVVPKSVRTLGTQAFSDCTSIESVEFLHGSEDKIEIGSGAFSNCDSLDRVILPKSLKEISAATFRNCKLNFIEWPDSLYTIAVGAFAGCKFSNISLPLTIRYLSSEAFVECAFLKELYIPANVNSGFSGSFVGCQSLKKIEVSVDNPIYDSRENCNAIIETASNSLISACNVSTIPTSVKAFGPYSFSRLPIEEFTIPSNVNLIEDCAFYFCDSLKKVILPETEIEFAYSAFSGCSNIKYFISNCTKPYFIDWGVVDAFCDSAFLVVPNESIGSYKNTAYWYRFKKIIGMNEYSHTTDISRTMVDNSPYHVLYQNGIITIYNIPIGSKITIYDLNGRILKRITSTTESIRYWTDCQIAYIIVNSNFFRLISK